MNRVSYNAIDMILHRIPLSSLDEINAIVDNDTSVDVRSY